MRSVSGFSSGFTIVEVMIVLIVSGLLLTAALTLTTGKLNQTEFDQAVNEATSQLQQIVSNVENGYYSGPLADTYSCTVSGGSYVITSGGSGSRGTNGPKVGSVGCIYLGEAVDFNNNFYQNNYYTFAIAGPQTLTSGNEDTAIYPNCSPCTSTDAPVIIAKSTANPGINVQGLKSAFGEGLDVYNIYDKNNDFNAIEGFIIGFSSEGNYQNPSATLGSGAHELSLYAIGNYSGYSGPAIYVNGAQDPIVSINDDLADISGGDTSLVEPNIEVCLSDGNNKWAVVTIQNGSGQLSVTSQEVASQC